MKQSPALLVARLSAGVTIIFSVCGTIIFSARDTIIRLADDDV